MSPQPGWFPDPWEQATLRWWDGGQWTHHVEGAHPPPPPAVPPPPAGAPAWSQPAVAPVTARPAAPAGLLPRLLVLGGAAVMATGSVLPWARVSAFFGTVDVAGTDGDGVVTVLCAVVIAVLSLVAFTGSGGRGFVAGALGAATVALVVALVDVADVARLVGSAEDVGFAGVEISIGVGLWLVLASSAAAVVGCALALRPVRPSA